MADGGRSGAKHARPWRRALARAGRGTRPWRRARAGKRARASRNGTVSRFEFADGGRLALFDKRRLGRVRLNPDTDALGPDAEEVTQAQFRQLIMKGTIAVKARLPDQSKIAGVGNLLADEALWQARIPARRTGEPAAAQGRRPAVPGPAVRAESGHRPRGRAHRGGHTGPPPGRHLPPLRCRDEAQHGRRPVDLVVLPGTAPLARAGGSALSSQAASPRDAGGFPDLRKGVLSGEAACRGEFEVAE